MQRDRRRLIVASTVTVAVLPAVWLANQSDDASPQPNVAAVGGAVEDATATIAPTSIDPMGTVKPQYLDGSAASGQRPAVTPVIGVSEGRVVGAATAIFRRGVNRASCLFDGVPPGSKVTVINVDNNRSIRCLAVPGSKDQPRQQLVMSAEAFAEIADPSAAPIDVEIRE